jgi:hypothetical protein
MINRFLLIFCFATAVFVSCQQEQDMVQPPEGSLRASSPLCQLMMRVAQQPTAMDNIIDSTSCFSIQLPVALVVNDQEMTVSSEDDYQTVAYILDQSALDVDSIAIIFPVTLTYANHEQVVVTSQLQYDAVLAACTPEMESEEIRCIDVNYPITFNTYDSNNQVMDVVEVSNDVQLFNFLNNADPDYILSVIYPVTLTKADGQLLVVDSNIAFEDAIEGSLGDCTPNNEWTGGPIMPMEDLIVNGTWHISYYYHLDELTSGYEDYRFTFYPNGSMVVEKDGKLVLGSWNVHPSESDLQMQLQFNNGQLGELQDEWRILDFNATNLMLRQNNNGNQETDHLYFTKDR